jgi:hypothetical protein
VGQGARLLVGVQNLVVLEMAQILTIPAQQALGGKEFLGKEMLVVVG